MEIPVPIPAFPGHSITSSGKVYHKGRLKKPIGKPGRSLKLRIIVNGKATELGLAKLMAQLFIPNPQNHERIIFKDGNPHNCTLSNIQWASHIEYVYHTLYPGKPIKQKLPQPPKPKNEKVKKTPPTVPTLPPEATPIPGWEHYHITPCGNVYNKKAKLMKHVFCGHKRTVRVGLYNNKGRSTRISVSKLLALTYLPNPHGFNKLIHKDHDPHNMALSNLLWVNNTDWMRHVRRLHEAAAILGMPLPPKEKPVYYIDPERVPLTGIPGYYITPAGKLYKENGKEVKPNIQGRRAPNVRIRLNGYTYSFGLATLVAEQFVPNPRRHKRIIFKDRNNQNCNATNLAWVDEQTFIYYCGLLGKTNKIQNERNYAIKHCKDPWLRKYYQTQDHYWLHECWKHIDKAIFMPGWEELKSEAYLYFVDRAQRFSILKQPTLLIASYAKGLRLKQLQEISPEITLSALLRTDETLRNWRRRD